MVDRRDGHSVGGCTLGAVGATCGSQRFGATAALTMSEPLRAAARAHCEDQATARYFSHESRDGRTFEQRIRQAGYTGKTPIGENIAAGQATPAAVMASWMSSPGHCANIMTPAYQAVGVGYATDADAPFTHYWTQDFGASR